MHGLNWSRPVGWRQGWSQGAAASVSAPIGGNLAIHLELHRFNILKVFLHRLSLCAVFFIALFPARAQTGNTQAPYYYAIENLDSGAVVRRGTATSAGIPPFGPILAPDTNYREWLYAVDTGLIGSVDFRSPTAGQALKIPAVPLGLPKLPDSDSDGLSDDAEFVIGT